MFSKEGLLRIQLIENEHFHSHLEDMRYIDETTLKDQVFFSAVLEFIK